jgi:hypothetical protein
MGSMSRWRGGARWPRRAEPQGPAGVRRGAGEPLGVHAPLGADGSLGDGNRGTGWQRGTDGHRGLNWQRSAHCASSACVEVAKVDDDRYLVRDSKDPRGRVLTFTAAEWEAFVAGVAAGDFTF